MIIPDPYREDRQERRADRTLRAPYPHHLDGGQALGLLLLTIAGVLLAAVIIAALVIGGGRDLASDVPTSLHP